MKIETELLLGPMKIETGQFLSYSFYLFVQFFFFSFYQYALFLLGCYSHLFHKSLLQIDREFRVSCMDP